MIPIYRSVRTQEPESDRIIGMQIRTKYVAAWIAATLVAVATASAAVGSVRSQVTDEALPLGSPEVVALAAGVADASDGGESLGATTTAIEGGVLDTSTTIPPATSTTDPVPGTGSNGTTASSPTTSTSPVTSTTTAPSEAKYSRTFDTDGGSVRVVVDGSDVSFGGAVPKTGWSIELKESGPKEVKVEFEQNGGSGSIEFTAKVEHGDLVTEISHDDDDHDD